MAQWQITIDEDAPTTLEAVNLRIVNARRVNAGVSTLTIEQAVANGKTATPLAVRTQIVIESAAGRAPFAKWWWGWITKITPGTATSKHGFTYEVSNAWYWFERLAYLQTWYVLVDPVNPQNSVVGGYKSTILLGRGANNTRLTIEEILQDIVTQVNLMASTSYGYASVVAGEAQAGDYPALNFPTRQLQNVTHGAAIRELLKWIPDAVAWIDDADAGGLPRLKITRAAQALANQIVIDAGNGCLGEVNIARDEEMEFTRVAIIYTRTDTVNGAQIGYSYADVYPQPVGFNAYDPATYGTFLFDFKCLTTSIDLQGFGKTTAYSTLATRVWDFTSIDWWRHHFPALRNVTTAVITPVRVIYEDGSEYTYDPAAGTAPTLLNELLNTGGAVIDGFFLNGTNTPIQRKRYRVEAHAAYETDSAKFVAQPIWAEFTATNGVTGTYARTENYENGETPVAGLAQQLYDAVSRERWSGSIQVKVQNYGEGSLCGQEVKLGDMVGIRNGRTEWSSAQMQVQAIDEDPHNGARTLHVGPPKFLSATDRIELIRGLRDYLTSGAGGAIAPGLMASGLAAGSRVTIPDRLPTQVGAQLHDGVERLTTTRETGETSAVMNGKNGITIEATADVAASGGDPAVKDGAKIEMLLSDCVSGAGAAKELKVRELDYCQDGVAKKILVVASEPYAG